MKFIPYSTSELLDYFDVINCIQDVQIVSNYINENKDDYSIGEIAMLKRLLFIYADLFTA